MVDSLAFSSVNRLTITVAYGPGPDGPPSILYNIVLDDPDFGTDPFDDREVLAELIRLADLASGDEDGSSPYFIDENKGLASWGADGSGIEILMFVADHALEGAVAGTVATATMALLNKFSQRFGGSTARQVPFIEGPRELEQYARWTVESHYKELVSDAQDLRLMEELKNATTWRGTFADNRGNEFEVTLESVDGNPYRQTLRWHAAPDS